MPAVVSDSSPLVYLTRLERSALLREIYGQVLIPSAVWREVAVVGAHLPEGRNVKGAVAEGWLVVKSPATPAASIGERVADLGDGEREAILLALERQALLIDEADGRRTAESLGLRCTGTVGVLVEAKLRRLIPALQPELDRLRSATTFRLADAVCRNALAAVGEALV